MPDSGESQETDSGTDLAPVDAVFVAVPRETGLVGRRPLFPESLDDPKIEEILASVREGRGDFVATCRRLGYKDSAVRMWAIRDTPTGFRDLYREARRAEMDVFADQTIDIADTCGTTAGEVYQAQLRIKTRQWRMERQAAQEFGNRGVVDDTGKPVAKQQMKIGNLTIEF